MVSLDIRRNPKGSNWEFQGGGDLNETKFLKESVEQKWYNFQGGWDVQAQKSLCGRVWIFSGKNINL